MSAETLFAYSRDFQLGRYSPLSAALAERHGIDEKDVLLGYGCEDLLKEAVHFHLRAGDLMLIPSASWWFYRVVASEVEAATAEYPVRRDAARYRYELGALRDAIDAKKPKLVLIASPNNPTGSSMERGMLEALLEEYPTLPIVLDQAYFGFLDEAAEPDHYAALTKHHPNLLVLRTFSKLYALAGVRVGYAFLGAMHAGLRRFQTRHLGFNRLAEQLALAALADDAYYGELRERFAVERQRLASFFNAHAGVTCFHSDANFVLVEMPEGSASAVQRDLVERGLQIKKFDEPAFLQCLRISLGTEAENDRLLAACEEFCPRALNLVGEKA
ncbi:MAG: aminotransferase class I/II-fold pyridoxal phosphate-dependent enzyme [Candidatus Eisenbacteria bacterium]